MQALQQLHYSVWGRYHYGRLLSYKQLTTLSVKLNLLVKDKEILDKKNKLLVRRKRGERWEKYKPLVLLLGVIIFCLLIYYLTS